MIVHIALAVGCAVILIEGWRIAGNYLDRPLPPTDRYCAWADARLDLAATTVSEPIGPYGHSENYVRLDWVREYEETRP